MWLLGLNEMCHSLILPSNHEAKAIAQLHCKTVNLWWPLTSLSCGVKPMLYVAVFIQDSPSDQLLNNLIYVTFESIRGSVYHICESVPSLYPFIWYLKCFSIFPKTYLLTKYPGFYSAHFLSKHEESFLCFCWWIKLNGALMCVFLVIWHTGRRTLWSIFMWHAETASMCLVSTSFRPFRTSSITSLTSLCWAVTQVHTTACSHMK